MSIRLFTTERGATVVTNIDVLETKAAGANAHLTLGTPLKIGVFAHLPQKDCQFEDLDELIARFGHPFAQRFQEIQRHRKYFAGPPVCPASFPPAQPTRTPLSIDAIGLVADGTLLQATHRAGTCPAACNNRRRPASDTVGCMQDDFEQHFSRTFAGVSDYCLGLYRGDGAEAARNGPGVGWGVIAFKASSAGRVHLVPFRISHKGFYVQLPGEHSSLLIPSLSKLVDKFKRAMLRTRQPPPAPAPAPAPPQYGQYAAGAGPQAAGGYGHPSRGTYGRYAPTGHMMRGAHGGY